MPWYMNYTRLNWSSPVKLHLMIVVICCVIPAHSCHILSEIAIPIRNLMGQLGTQVSLKLCCLTMSNRILSSLDHVSLNPKPILCTPSEFFKIFKRKNFSGLRFQKTKIEPENRLCYAIVFLVITLEKSAILIVGKLINQALMYLREIFTKVHT